MKPQYIDKAAVVAEIEKLEKEHPYNPYSENYESGYDDGYLGCCSELLSFFDTLEVKAADLEKEIHKFIDKEELHLRLWDVDRIAKYFFELGLKAQKGE